MATLEDKLGISFQGVRNGIDTSKIYKPEVKQDTLLEKIGGLTSSRLQSGSLSTDASLQGALQGVIGKAEQTGRVLTEIPSLIKSGVTLMPSSSGLPMPIATTQEAQQKIIDAEKRISADPTSKAYQYYGDLAKLGEEKAQTARDKYVPQSKTEEFVGGLIESVPAMAGAAITTAAGAPGVGATILGASSGGREFRSGMGQGVEFEQSFTSGLISGGAEGLLSTISLGLLDDVFKSGSAPLIQKGLTYAKSVLGEALEEGATEAISILGQKVTYDKDKQFDMGQIGEAALGGAVMALFFGALGGGSTTAINALQDRNVTRAELETIANEQGTTLEQVEQKAEQATAEAEPVQKQIAQESINVNKLSANEIKQELASRGIDDTGTASEVRNRLKSTLQTETDTNVPTRTETSLEEKIGLEPTARVEAMKAQQPTLEAKLSKPEIQGYDRQLTEQASNILESINTENLNTSIRQLKIIKNQADKHGLDMNLQLFSKSLQDDINALDELEYLAPSSTKLYNNALLDIINKGGTKATIDEMLKLAEIKSSISGLKAKHATEIQQVKDKFKAKNQARKESGIRSKLLTQVKKMQKQRMQPEFQAVANELFANIDSISKSMSSRKQLELQETLANIEAMREEGIEVDPNLEKAVARLDKKRISDMEISEVEELLDIANNLTHLNRTKNKALAIEKQENIDDIKNGIIDGLRTKPSRKAQKAMKTNEAVENNKLIDSLSLFLGKPANTLRTLMYEVGRANPDSMAVKLGDAIFNRQNVELANRRELNELLNGYMQDYKKIASSKEWNAEQDVNGKKMTSGQKVYLKLALNDANVLNSIVEKGYRRKGQVAPTKVTKEELQAIQLNETEQKAYDASTEFFDSTYNLLNEAFLLQNGYELYKNPDGGYLPKVVSDITLREELGQVQQPGGLKNTGIVQERKGTLNELVLPDIMDVYDRQLNVATKYNAYTNIVDDVSKVFNSPTLRNSLRAEYGTRKTKGEKQGKSIVEEYMDDMFQDLQGTKVAKPTRGEGFFRTIRTKAAPAILAYRATTPLLQTASYPIAVTEISPSNLAKGLAQKGGFDEASQYNERANARSEGRIDRELAESNVNKIVDFGLKPIQFMDKQTVGKLWNATKLQVQQETGLQGEQLLQETSKRFDRVLDTQPNYTTADRSMTMRSQSELDKALTMFSSAKSSVVNELKRGYIEGKYTGDWTQLTKAVSGLGTSILMMAGISNLLKKAGGDDEKFSETLLSRATGALPGLDMFSSLINGYGISNVGADAVEDLAQAFSSNVDLISKIAQGEEVTEQKVVKTFWNTVDAIALMTGVPVETVRKDVQLIANTALPKEGELLVERFTDPMTKTEYYSELEDAAKSGDKKMIIPLLEVAKNSGISAKGIKGRLDAKEERIVLPLLKREYFD